MLRMEHAVTAAGAGLALTAHGVPHAAAVLRRGFTTISGHNTICRFIADSSKLKAQLLGRTPEANALISQWLSYRNLELVPHLMDDKLHKVRRYARAGLPHRGCLSERIQAVVVGNAVRRHAVRPQLHSVPFRNSCP